MSPEVPMRALRLHAVRSGPVPPDVRVDHLERPTCGPTQVTVAVRAAGIGGVELAMLRGELDPGSASPRTIGSELAGVIDQVGDEVIDWHPGDRVAVVPAWPCRRCPTCRGGREDLCPRRRVPGVDVDGGAAGAIVVDGDDLVPLPGDLPFPDAALAAGPAAAAYRALKQAGVHADVTVAVLGLGGCGLPAVALARLVGARVVGIDTDPIALDRALAWGADEVVDAAGADPAAEVRRITDGGCDRVLDCAGRGVTVDLALRCLLPGGRAVTLGTAQDPVGSIPVQRLSAEELELAGSSGASAQDLGELLDLIAAGRLELGSLVSATVALEHAADAVRTLEDGGGPVPRTVITDLG
jgi:D-arabinose 1-dehydrogenase-like Zn-dependent alcohol dehydrogenase